mmetsp:Transcript_118265/g.334237  ORF Transcript_118265/g.334237 Transcript_118265/m.334237 type:complete len:555 (-) Transcript_118265:144-1808(-)
MAAARPSLTRTTPSLRSTAQMTLSMKAVSVSPSSKSKRMSSSRNRWYSSPTTSCAFLYRQTSRPRRACRSSNVAGKAATSSATSIAAGVALRRCRHRQPETNEAIVSCPWLNSPRPSSLHTMRSDATNGASGAARSPSIRHSRPTSASVSVASRAACSVGDVSNRRSSPGLTVAHAPCPPYACRSCRQPPPKSSACIAQIIAASWSMVGFRLGLTRVALASDASEAPRRRTSGTSSRLAKACAALASTVAGTSRSARIASAHERRALSGSVSAGAALSSLATLRLKTASVAAATTEARRPISSRMIDSPLPVSSIASVTSGLSSLFATSLIASTGTPPSAPAARITPYASISSHNVPSVSCMRRMSGTLCVHVSAEHTLPSWITGRRFGAVGHAGIVVDASESTAARARPSKWASAANSTTGGSEVLRRWPTCSCVPSARTILHVIGTIALPSTTSPAQISARCPPEHPTLKTAMGKCAGSSRIAMVVAVAASTSPMPHVTTSTRSAPKCARTRRRCASGVTSSAEFSARNRSRKRASSRTAITTSTRGANAAL